MSVITLTTDFGTRDWFVGTMKGVIAALAPTATVVDVTHEVPPGDVRSGAFALMAGWRYFPKRTVHVVVVDPGVGSDRAAIAIRAGNHCFVGPDNGVLSWALRREKIQAVRKLENEAFFLQPVSRTFHGRDIFAPVAAHLSRGLDVRRLGPPLTEFVRLPWPEPAVSAREVRGEVLHMDRFGNAITNIPADALPVKIAASTRARSHPRRAAWSVFLEGRRLCDVAEFYQAVPPGRPVAVFGSSGFLEVAVNGGSAAKQFRIKAGTLVRLRPARDFGMNFSRAV